MKVLTVKDLSILCKELMNEGLGNRQILISRDDECNGFHYLYPYVTSEKETIKQFEDVLPYELQGTNLENIILLG